jgi:hypothetical protein
MDNNGAIIGPTITRLLVKGTPFLLTSMGGSFPFVVVAKSELDL